MKNRTIFGIYIFLFLLLAFSNNVTAHGKPVITLANDVVKAGGQMTIKGTKIHPGAVYNVTLESMEGSMSLGRAKANKKGSFAVQFALPIGVAGGSHKVRVEGKDGESTLLNLTVSPRPHTANNNPLHMITDANGKAKIDNKNSSPPLSGGTSNSMPMAMSPSGNQLQLDRGKTPVEAGSTIAIVLASTLFGTVLIRKRIS